MDKDRLKMPLDENIKYNFDDVNNLIDRLLGENGCPWDKEQTIRSLKKYLLEESYEAAWAIDKSDMAELSEELGDVLFQIVFMAKLAKNKAVFDINDVTDMLVRKMVSRHTHIFGEDTAGSPLEVELIWKKNKFEEKKLKSLSDKLSAVPLSLPSLMRAQKTLSIACEDGGNKSGNISGFAEETAKLIEELKDAPDEGKMEIVGKLLLAIADISNDFQINAEFALTNELKTYINKFENIENHDKYVGF